MAAAKTTGPHDELLAELKADMETYFNACDNSTWKEINASLWVVQKKLWEYYNKHGYPRMAKDNPNLTMGR